MAINDLYKRLSQSSVAVSPTALLMQLRRLAPQFAETDQRGQYAQQGEWDGLAETDCPRCG